MRTDSDFLLSVMQVVAQSEDDYIIGGLIHNADGVPMPNISVMTDFGIRLNCPDLINVCRFQTSRELPHESCHRNKTHVRRTSESVAKAVKPIDGLGGPSYKNAFLC